jgi:hypothetical protein
MRHFRITWFRVADARGEEWKDDVLCIRGWKIDLNMLIVDFERRCKKKIAISKLTLSLLLGF